MNKFSVIIPTIQKKLKILQTLLNIMVQDSCVDEIIVINNRPDKKLDFGFTEKLSVIVPEQNLYVNPSWNLGVSIMKNENFALLNDDMLVCNDFISKISESDVFNDKNTGLIGVDNKAINQFYDTDAIDNLEIPSQIMELEFSPLTKYLSIQDWGIAILGKKENFYKIPDDLKIIFGDNYLLYKNLQNNKTNYQVSGIAFNHVHSTSSGDKMFSKIIAEDLCNHRKYLKKDDLITMSETKEMELNFKLEYNKNVFFLEYMVDGKKNTISFKLHKDKKYLSDFLVRMLPVNTKKDVIDQIIEEVISQSKAY